MRILHTSDWHVGRTIRGRSREHEHAGLLREMLDLVDRERVDLVLVAGDQFDAAVPSSAAERLVWSALAGFTERGADVVVIAGNHDHAARLDALAPVLTRGGGIVVGAYPRPPGRGGVAHVATRSGDARVAMVPFLSQRGIVKTADLLAGDAAEHAQQYAQRVKVVLDALTAGFGGGDTVDLVCAHLTVVGSPSVADRLGGGERLSHVFDYLVPPQQLPSNVQYVALGHLHQPHDVPGPAPIRYSGSPLHLDFGEVASARGVTLVDAEAGRPVQRRHVPLSSGYALRTLTGSLEQLEAAAADLGDRVHVRAVVDEAPRAGLAERVRELVPHAVDVRIARPDAPAEEVDEAAAHAAAASSPAELFEEYLASRGIVDARVGALFRALLDEWQEAQRDDSAASAGGTR